MDVLHNTPAPCGRVAPSEAIPASRHARERRGAIAAIIVALLILMVPFSATFQYGGEPMDEGTLLVYPEMIQHGAVPYRDFESFYGPANPYLLAATYSILGTNIDVERTVGLLYRGLILIALFGLTRHWGTPIATGCLLVAGFLLLPLGVVAYAWFGAMACAISFIWALATPGSNWRCWAGGLLAGLALAFRPDVGPAVILAALVLLQPLPWSQRLRFAAGATLWLMPFVLLFLLSGAEQLFNNLFLYPVIRCGPGRRMPLFSAQPYQLRIFFALVLAAAVNITVWFLAVRAHPKEQRVRVLLALSLLGAGVIPQAWQRLDTWHLLFVAFLVVGILPLTVFSLTRRQSGDRFPTLIPLGATLVVAALMGAIAPLLPGIAVADFRAGLQTTPARSVSLHQAGRSFPVDSPETAVSIGRLLDRLDRLSKPGERLFVGPADLRRTNYCDTFIYHLAPKLRPATYFLEMNPLSANRPGSRLASDIASADWLVLNRAWDVANEPNRSVEYGSTEPGDIVRERFLPAGRFGSYLLFRRAR